MDTMQRIQNQRILYMDGCVTAREFLATFIHEIGKVWESTPEDGSSADCDTLAEALCAKLGHGE